MTVCRRFGFRFLASYLALYCAGTVFFVVPIPGSIAHRYYLAWEGLAVWLGRSVLRLPKPISVVMTGSGDRLVDWIQALAMLGLALVIASVWVWFDRERRRDRLVGEMARILVRFFLGAVLLSYGTFKILHQQMPSPGYYALLETYGHSSPMRLAWTFMGLSNAYSAYIGFSEAAAGVLLLFRRTILLGALLGAVVMFNVLMINLCFDVPVKLYSAHLFLLCAYVAAPAFSGLTDVLLRHRPSEASPPHLEFSRPWIRRSLFAAKLLAVGWIIYTMPVLRIWTWAQQPAPAKSDLYGLYDVESFFTDGVDRPPLTTDAQRWQRVAIDEKRIFCVQYMDGRITGYRFTADTKAGKLVLNAFWEKPAATSTITYIRPNPAELILDGKTPEGLALSVHLRRANDRDLLLIKRGFHWISEVPFNR